MMRVVLGRNVANECEIKPERGSNRNHWDSTECDILTSMMKFYDRAH